MEAAATLADLADVFRHRDCSLHPLAALQHAQLRAFRGPSRLRAHGGGWLAPIGGLDSAEQRVESDIVQLRDALRTVLHTGFCSVSAHLRQILFVGR